MLFKGKPCPSCKTQETSLLVSSTPLISPPPGQRPCTSDFSQRLIHFAMSYRCQVFPNQFWLKAFDTYWTRMWKRNPERKVGWEKERQWPRLWDSSTVHRAHRVLLRSLLSLVVVIQSLSHVWLFMTPWTAACRTSLSFSISQSLLKLIHWVDDAIQPSHSLLPPFPPALNFPSIGVFSNESHLMAKVLELQLQHVLPVNIKDWFPLGLVGLISLLSKGLSRVFSSTTIQKHQFFSTQPSLEFNSHTHAWLLEKP